MLKLFRILTILLCMGLITAFLGCASSQKRESTGEYVDDSVITTKVKAALAREPAVSAFQVNVETYEGVVQLSGFVDSPENVKKAEEVAAGVKGVKEVKNNLIVKK